MKTITVDVKELPGRFAELVKLASAGEAQVLVTDGPTTAQLTGYREFIFDMHPGAMVMRDDFDDPVDEDAFLRGDV